MKSALAWKNIALKKLLKKLADDLVNAAIDKVTAAVAEVLTELRRSYRVCSIQQYSGV